MDIINVGVMAGEKRPVNNGRSVILIKLKYKKSRG
jgi:hypothetical protein